MSIAGEHVDKDEASALRWYHTIELGGGRCTEGMFDHRPYVPRYGLPPDLTGLRALDVGTFDGFWAFELESRGADVVALDVPRSSQLDWPVRQRPRTDDARGETFKVAARARGSSVRWVGGSIYDVAPRDLGGPFDLVFCGSVAIHLRDPMLALQRMHGLCRDRFVFAEEYSRRLERIPRVKVAEFRGEAPYMTWWRPTTSTWMSMIRTAGFEDVTHHERFALRYRQGRRRGVPHTVIHARSSARPSAPPLRPPPPEVAP